MISALSPTMPAIKTRILITKDDTVSTMYVLHYWTPSTGPYTDEPSGRAASGVDR
jgi:hypothetical protein